MPGPAGTMCYSVQVWWVWLQTVSWECTVPFIILLFLWFSPKSSGNRWNRPDFTGIFVSKRKRASKEKQCAPGIRRRAVSFLNRPRIQPSPGLIFLFPPQEGSRVHLQLSCRAPDGIRPFQGLGNEPGFKPLHLVLEASVPRLELSGFRRVLPLVPGRYPVGGRDGGGGVEIPVVHNGQVLRQNFLPIAHDKGPLHHVAQLPDVSRPAVLQQGGLRSGGNGLFVLIGVV